MKVYKLTPRPTGTITSGDIPLHCAIMGGATFHRRFQCILGGRLDRIADHAHALEDGDTPHFLLAAIQEEVQNIGSTAVSAGWLTLALLARDVDRTIQELWRASITTQTARQVSPALHKLLDEGAKALRRT